MRCNKALCEDKPVIDLAEVARVEFPESFRGIETEDVSVQGGSFATRDEHSGSKTTSADKIGAAFKPKGNGPEITLEDLAKFAQDYYQARLDSDVSGATKTITIPESIAAHMEQGISRIVMEQKS